MFETNLAETQKQFNREIPVQLEGTQSYCIFPIEGHIWQGRFGSQIRMKTGKRRGNGVYWKRS